MNKDAVERGSVLPLVAAGVFFIMGMVAFGVDLGWFFLNASRQQTAADSASLAAVVALPADDPVWSNTTAFATAIQLGETSGYLPAEIIPEEVFRANGTKIENQIKVTVRRSVRTFFLQIFGRDSVTIARSSTAEFIPPLQLGSDSPALGNFPSRPPCDEFGEPAGACANPIDPTTWGGGRPGFWLAINAEHTAKEHGDPFMTRCLRADRSGCLSSNSQFTPDGYFYGIDVPASSSGLRVSVFDARYWTPPTPCSFCVPPVPDQVAAGDFTYFADAGPVMTYRLFRPDATPANPADNSTLACPATVLQPDDNGFAPGDPSNFRPFTICSNVSGSGLYILQIKAGAGHSINGFSVAATTSGPAPAVFGIGRMSLKVNQTSGSPVFRLVKVTPLYAGKRITVSIFDPGDLSGEAWVFIEGLNVSSLPCEIEITRESGTRQGPYSPDGIPWDGGPPGGAPACWIQTSPTLSGSGSGPSSAEYNGDWVDFHFDVPDDYSCDPQSANECWWNVRYVFAATEVFDRTTWRASVQGQPIRLVLTP